jgi:cell division protein FtsZ
MGICFEPLFSNVWLENWEFVNHLLVFNHESRARTNPHSGRDMTIKLAVPNLSELKPRITVFGVGGAGGNAVNNMIESRLDGVEFVVANTDAQALMQSAAERRVQMGTALTQGLGAGSQPLVGAAAAEEALPEILDHLAGSHMCFITAGMGGGTGTGAAPVIARAAKEQGILTVGVVTKPFHFEGARRIETAERGIDELARYVDTLIVIPNQNLFRVANEKTTFAAAFAMADQVLYSGVASITELMTKEGLINLDFADVRAIMSEMGKAMMGTGEASGEKRAIEAAEAAISNPLLDDVSMRGARGLLISICGGPDLTLYEVDEAATRIREEVDPNANIILGATFDNALEGTMRVSVVATGLTSEQDRLAPVTRYAEPATAVSSQSSYTAAPAPIPVAQSAADHVRVVRPAASSSAGTHYSATATTHSSPAPAIQRRATNFAPPPPAPVEYEEEAEQESYTDHVVEERRIIAPSRANPTPSAASRVMKTEFATPSRMPAVDDFPPIAREQIAAQQSRIEAIASGAATSNKPRFLERLANAGNSITKRGAPGSAPVAPRAPVKQAATESQQDGYDDDQLAIPAFLRRQARG